MSSRLQLALLAQFLALQLAAQTELRTELLDIGDGLSQNFVAALAQDREGFLWAGTKNGLNRYDGRQFKVWTNDPENPNSLANDWVWSLETHEDFLLIGTDGGGLDFFDRRNARIFHLPRPPEVGGVVTKVQLAPSKKDIWLLAGGGRGNTNFFRLRLPEGFWGKLAAGDSSVFSEIKIATPAPGIFQNFAFANENKAIWGLAGHEFIQFDPETCAQIRRVTAPGDFTGWYAFPFVEAGGELWCFRESRIFWFDGQAWQSRGHVFTKNVRHVGFDWQNRFLFYESGKLYAFNLKKVRESTSLLGPPDADWQCDATGQPTGYLLDRSGNFWWGTNAGGIQKLNMQRQNFRHFFAGNSVYATPFEDSDGSKSYFDFGKGFQFSSKTPSGVVARFARTLQKKEAFIRVLQAGDGAYWLLMTYWEGCQLVKIAPDGQTQTFPFESPGKQPGNFFMDKSGKIWIGSNGRLLGFEPTTAQFQQFDYRDALPIEHEVYTLTETSGGTIWLGTSQGLVKCQPSASGFQFSLLKNEPGNPNSLRKNSVAALLADPADESVLWLGTKGGGLTRLETKTGKMRHLTARNGLPDDVIYGILTSPQPPLKEGAKNSLPFGEGWGGALWLSSNKGIIRYNPATSEIRNFTEADGAQGDEFNTWAFAKTSSGNLLFGGLNGLNEINPADFSENPNLPPVFLTGLKINNQLVEAGDSTGVLTQNLEFLPKIELPFSKNSLTLTFSALEFTAPAKNRFRYFLENAEREWAHETTENAATYLNLSPGNYTFKVMASNGDGVWNPQPAELKITVRPPWWRSWLAYLIYIGVAAAALRWLYRLQLRRRLEHAENERLKELDSFKSRLYANITHEFRTPLTVILGNADLLENEISAHEKPETKIPKLQTVRRNAQRLLALVNQILDLSKVENNALQLQMQRADVVAFLKYLVESFQSFANASNQALRFFSDFAEFQMDFDAERLNQVMSNLISNALKFTPSGGVVEVKCRAEFRSANASEPNVPRKGTQQHLLLTVSDTGVGISPEDLPQVFDRFFQAKNQSQNKAGGTGIGLSLTKELVKLFGGEISAESQLGRGTTFTVRLPVTKNAPQAAVQASGNFQFSETLFDSTGREPDRQPPAANLLPAVLIVEDNPDVVAYLKNILQQKFQISVAYNGRVGVEMAFAETPDLILSDLMMPEKDGLEVCAELKNDLRTSHVPLVLLTARAAVEDRVAGIRQGADAYLAKPFHPAELLAVLENLLATRQRLQARFAKMVFENEQTSPRAEGIPLGEISAGANLENAPAEEAFLKNLRAFILENLSNSALELEDLCRAAGMGKSNLHAKLTALTGQSPMLFLRNLRLARAHDLLRAGGKNVSEVAFEVGFDDPKYFSRAFSDHFGIPPSKI